MSARFFRNAAAIGVAEFIAKAKALLILPLLTRHLGADGFGAWSQVTMLTMLLLPLVIVSSDAAVVRLFPALDAERQRRGFSAWVLWLVAAGAFWGLAAWAARGPLGEAFFSGDQIYRQFIPLAAVNIAVTALISAGRVWFRSHNDANTVAAISIGQTAMNLAAVAIGILLQAGAYEIVLFTVIGDLVVAGGALGRYSLCEGWRRPDFAFVPRMLRFGLPLVPAGYAMWGLNWADRLFIVHYRGLADVGVYAAASGLGYAAIQVFVNPIWAMYPNVATDLYQRRAMDELNALVRSTGLAILALALPSAFGLWAVGPNLMSLLGGASFAAGADVMAIVTLAYLLMMISSYYEVTLGFVYRQHLSTMAVSLAFFVNLALNFLLIPPLGILGAAIATLLAFGAQLMFAATAAKRHVPEWQGLRIPWRVILASAIMAIAVRSLDNWIGDRGIEGLALLIFVGAGLYLALAVILKIVPAPVVTAVAGRLAGRWREQAK